MHFVGRLLWLPSLTKNDFPFCCSILAAKIHECDDCRIATITVWFLANHQSNHNPRGAFFFICFIIFCARGVHGGGSSPTTEYNTLVHLEKEPLNVFQSFLIRVSKGNTHSRWVVFLFSIKNKLFQHLHKKQHKVEWGWATLLAMEQLTLDATRGEARNWHQQLQSP